MKLILLSLIVLLTSQESSKLEPNKPIVVLELFTSQGCSSCPPADELLKEINKNYDDTQVLALSYHVDYWNYIGWKDPFSKVEFSELQRQYAQKFNSSSIYTPQIVINGREHFVGSNEGILKSKIKSYMGKNADNKVSITNVKKNDTSISFDYNVDGTISKKKLRVALVIDERTTSILKGENKNRSLKNSNIVVALLNIELKSESGKGTIDVPQLVKSFDDLSLVGIIETSDLNLVGGIQLKL